VGDKIRRISVAISIILILIVGLMPYRVLAEEKGPAVRFISVVEGPYTITIADEETTNRTIDYVPLLDQQDYPDIPFSQGTVSTSGCGITCVAMIGSYFRNEFISPGDLGKQFNLPGMGNDKRMEAASNALGLPLQGATYSWSKAYEALQNGQLVICLQHEGIFTSGGHFIVLTGINEEGKITVNDPYGYNWTRSEETIEGFANGFEIEQITKAGVKYWIYEPKPLEKVEYPEWKNTTD
jgi:hypothetical protein